MNYMTDYQSKLKEIYYDPTTGFGSVKALTEIAKKAGIKATAKQIKDWYDIQQTTEVFKKRKPEFRKIIAPPGVICLQTDLMDISRYSTVNKSKFIIVVIDVTSRYVWVKHLPGKTAKPIASFIESIIKELRAHVSHSQKEITLTSDSGKEFVNVEMKSMLTKHNVRQYTVNSSKETHTGATAIVERFHRTLWNLLKKYMQYNKTTKFVDVLSSLIKNYNNRIHSSTMKTPSDVLYDTSLSREYRMGKKIVKKSITSFQVGDSVRIALKATKLSKKSVAQKYSETIYKVTAKDGNRYVITNGRSELKQHYLARDLMKVNTQVPQPEANDVPYEVVVRKNDNENLLQNRIQREFGAGVGFGYKAVTKAGPVLDKRLQPKSTGKLRVKPGMKRI